MNTTFYLERFENMVRTLKVFVEKKTFLVRLEGEHGGNWCSITEHSRGSAFVLGFEKDVVGWMIEHLTKDIEMKIIWGSIESSRENYLSI